MRTISVVLAVLALAACSRTEMKISAIEEEMAPYRVACAQGEQVACLRYAEFLAEIQALRDARAMRKASMDPVFMNNALQRMPRSTVIQRDGAGNEYRY